jgi:hypothetical protein
VLSTELEADKKAETGRVRSPKFEVIETQHSALLVALHAQTRGNRASVSEG